MDGGRSFDIIVAGAGPAGLAFTAALAGCGLRIALVERLDEAGLAAPRTDGREIAITHRSRAILESLGAWRRIDPCEVSPLREARVLDGAGRTGLLFGGGGKVPLGQLVPNHLLRRALFETMRDQAGVDLLAGTAIAAAWAGAEGAQVLLANGRRLRARLLVAADSRFSAVRRQLGIAAEVRRIGRSMLLCRVAHEGDHGGIATEWFGHGQTIAMLPLGDGRLSSAVLTLPAPEIDRIAALDADALGREITRRYGGRLGAMRVVEGPHVYPLAVTWARHFVASGAALIGDAAVGMHPVTAHGFNLGLQGASRLARLIRTAALGSGDIAGEGLLTRYETDHRLAAHPLYAATNMIVRLYTDDRPAARLARRAILRAGMLPPVRRAIGGLLMQRGPAYGQHHR